MVRLNVKTAKNIKFKDDVSFDARSLLVVPAYQASFILPNCFRWSNIVGIETTNFAASLTHS